MNIRDYKNILWNTVGTVINSFSSLIYLVIVTRINGINVSGVFSFCFSFSLMLYTAANLGGRVFEVSDKGRFNDSNYLTLKIFTCILSIVVALAFAFIMKYEAIKIFLILIFMLVRSIEAFSDTFYAVLQKNEHLDFVGISYFIKNILCFFVFFAVDIITRDILLSSVALLITTLSVYFLYDYRKVLQFEKLQLVFDFKNIIALFKNIFNFMIFNLLTMVIANIPRIIVDLYYSDTELGYFGILIMIPTVVILLGQLIIQPFLNTLSENFHSKQYNEILFSVKKILALITFVSLLCAVGAYILGPWALRIFYGVDLTSFRLAIFLLVIAGMFNCYSAMLSTVLTVIRKTGIQLVIYSSVLVFEAIFMAVVLRFTDFSIVFWIYLGIMILQFIIFILCYHYLFVRRYLNAKS